MSRDKPIPQTDPLAGYRDQAAAIDAAVARVLHGGRYILGEEVAAFEREFAEVLGARHAVGVASGTDALVLGLKALGVGPGDGVATVSHTAVATVAAIELTGATPILVDVDPTSFTMCVADLEAMLDRPPLPVKAVIPVHLYGHPADLPRILALASRHGAAVLEDAAQAHGAELDGRRVGNWGALAAFSFYPTKNLGAFGDAGAVVANDDDLAARIRSLREYGWRERYVSDVAGANSRLDELQAAILRVKLARLEADNGRRRAIAQAYAEGLAGLPLILPGEGPTARHVYHQYVVRTPGRDPVRAGLAERGIGSAVHYPLPVHLQPAYRGRLPTGPARLAVTEAIAPEILSLPIYPQLRLTAVAQVTDALRTILGGEPTSPQRRGVLVDEPEGAIDRALDLRKG